MKRAFVVSCSLSLVMVALSLGILIDPGSHRLVSAASPFEVTQGVPIINTVAGGGFSSSVPVKAAPMIRPTVAALDPSVQSGFGLYVVDEIQGRTVIRFANASAGPLTRAGVTIQAGEIAVVAGGGDIFEQIDGLPARTADLFDVTGLVVHPTGNAIFLNTPDYRALLAINVSTQNFVISGKTVQPGRIGALVDHGFLYSVGLVLRPNNDFYVVANPFGAPQLAVVARLRVNDTPFIVAGGGTPMQGTGNGEQALQARLLTPIGIGFDSEDNLIIAEAGSGRTLGSIRKVGAQDQIINELIPNLDYPVGLSQAPDGSFLVPLGNAQQVGRFTTNSSSLTIVAGDQSKLACTPNSNPTCGDGGPALSAKLNIPGSESQRIIQVAPDATGFFLPDSSPLNPTPYAHVRYVNTSGSPVTKAGTLIPAGGINSIIGTDKLYPYDQGLALYADLNGPRSVGVTAAGNLFISDTLNDRIRFVNRGGSPITLFSGTPSAQTVQPGQIVSINFLIGEEVVDDRISTALFNSLQGLHIVANGIYVADALAGVRFPNTIGNPNSGLIKFINTSGSPVVFYPGSSSPITVNPGDVKTIAGLKTGPGVNPSSIGDNGPALMAVIYPADVAVDSQGNIFIADYEATRTNRIRRVNAANGVVTTIYGDGSPLLVSKPVGIAVDATNRVIVADTFNNRILRQNAAGSAEFSTIADGSMGLQRPRDVAVAPDGTIVVTSTGNYRILRITAPNNSLGTAAVVGGTGAAGYSGDGGPADQALLALANQPQNDINQETVGITVAANGAILFADTNNGRIRQIFDEPPLTLTSVSAATFTPDLPLATESIVAGFGPNVAPTLALASSVPLPFELLGTTVEVKDSAQTTRPAPLFAVAENQVNYLIPPGTVLGPATVTVRTGAGKVLVSNITIASVEPGLFTVTQTGSGVATGQFQRYTGAGLIGVQDTFQFNGQAFVPLPIAFGPPDEALFLILYGTGFRFRTGLSGVGVTIGGVNAPVTFAGQQGFFVGVDQLNVGPLPRSLQGRGTVDVVLTVDGRVARTVQVGFQ